MADQSIRQQLQSCFTPTHNEQSKTKGVLQLLYHLFRIENSPDINQSNTMVGHVLIYRRKEGHTDRHGSIDLATDRGQEYIYFVKSVTCFDHSTQSFYIPTLKIGLRCQELR